MTEAFKPPSLEEAERSSEAYAKTVNNPEWQKCGTSHWDALPTSVQDGLTDYKAEIIESRAVVLEVLPPNKRSRVERALNFGRLEAEEVPGTRYTLVREKTWWQGLVSLAPSPAMLEVLRG